MTIKKTALLAATALICATPLTAAHAEGYTGAYLTPSVGYYDAVRHKFPGALFGLEYRFDEWSSKVRPIIGGFMTSHGGAYGYVGANYDVTLVQNQLYLVPNFSVGAYHDGDGRKLGGTLEFRSGIELDYQLPGNDQVGVALNHISNAGIYKHNPGEENVLVNYSIPVAKLF